MHSWQDLTLPISEATSVFPGDPAISCRVTSDYPESGFRVTQYELGSHVGTHIDAPSHVIPNGTTVTQLNPDLLIGEARVVDLRGHAPRQEITIASIEAALPCRRLLLCTGWDTQRDAPGFFSEMPGLSLDAARYLIENGVAMVGIDAPNIHGSNALAVHRLLLSAGVPIVEGLVSLAQFAGSDIFLIVAPLCLAEADGAPTRIFARPLSVAKRKGIG